MCGVSFIMQIPFKYFYTLLFSKYSFFASNTYGVTPTAKLWYFLLGAVVYFASIERKHPQASMICATVVLLGVYTSRPHYITAGITALLILVIESTSTQKTPVSADSNRFFKNIVLTLSKYSFHIYLIHMFAFAISSYLGENILSFPSGSFQWFVVSLVICVLLIYILEMLRDFVFCLSNCIKKFLF